MAHLHDLHGRSFVCVDNHHYHSYDMRHRPLQVRRSGGVTSHRVSLGSLTCLPSARDFLRGHDSCSWSFNPPRSRLCLYVLSTSPTILSSVHTRFVAIAFRVFMLHLPPPALDCRRLGRLESSWLHSMFTHSRNFVSLRFDMKECMQY